MNAFFRKPIILPVTCLLLILLGVLFLRVWFGETLQLQRVRKEVEQANDCAVDSDCVSLGSVCSMGCDVLVNKSAAREIQELLNGSDLPDCDITCPYNPNSPVCHEGLCQRSY